MRTPNYDKRPVIAVPGQFADVRRGWTSVAVTLREALDSAPKSNRPAVLAIESYVGVFDAEIRAALSETFAHARWIVTRDAMLAPDEIHRITSHDAGADDPIFGYLTSLTVMDFFSPLEIDELRTVIARASGPVIVIGPGACLIAPENALLVYADLPRWEAQLRQRRHEISNLGLENESLSASLKYKRSFFVDWRVCDRIKKQTMHRWDFLMDTCIPGDPKLVPGELFREALVHCTKRPFRVVPFFDPGPWGGQWMKQVCDLDPAQANFAWCFDCVPEENSLLLAFGSVTVEIPAIDLVFSQPRALLGEPVHGRFGPEFPIRFDLLDTLGGGNLSLQVHPLTEYIQERFGMRYTQDESYYLLDAKPGAVVYLGRRKNIAPAQLLADLEAAQRGEKAFDAEHYVARFSAQRHDHFLIPAGTLHCSGRDCVVLEISATPYIFTFKLWDWGRMGLDGQPRPINIQHGKNNICWERDEEYAAGRLINQVTGLARGEGWREEHTGLHEAGFIETRRHWFTGSAAHDTGGARSGSVNVLNLVQGEEVLVESPDNAFQPFVVHYAETFIVPAAVGRYRITPHGHAAGTECATIKAYVRCRP